MENGKWLWVQSESREFIDFTSRRLICVPNPIEMRLLADGYESSLSRFHK